MDDAPGGAPISFEWTKWRVAVYWPTSFDYGGVSEFPTLEKAMEHRDWLSSKAMGYKRENIHIWRKSKALIDRRA